MPAITTDRGTLHFDMYGKGKPVLLLHGWLGGWGLWQETMAYLGQYFRTYSLDFWGFGDAGHEQAGCQLTDFVAMVDQFMERMGIINAALVGHSLGGTVALMTALRYPRRVEKVAAISAPLQSAWLALPFRLASLKISRSLSVALFPLSRWIFRAAAPRLCSDPRFRDWTSRDLTRAALQRFLGSLASLNHTDIAPQLGKIPQPLLVMYGDRDNIIHPRQWSTFERSALGAQVTRFNNAGHFVMLDESRAFMQTLKIFLDSRTEKRT